MSNPRVEMADEEKVRTAIHKRQELMKIAMEVQEKDNIEKHDVLAEGRHYQVGGSSSSASALGETDVVIRTQAIKKKKSEDDGTDLTERHNKRAKEMCVAGEMEVSEIIVNKEDETESWSFGDEAQWAMDDRSGRRIDVELAKGSKGGGGNFHRKFASLGGVQLGRMPCKRTGKDPYFDEVGWN